MDTMSLVSLFDKSIQMGCATVNNLLHVHCNNQTTKEPYSGGKP